MYLRFPYDAKFSLPMLCITMRCVSSLSMNFEVNHLLLLVALLFRKYDLKHTVLETSPL